MGPKPRLRGIKINEEELPISMDKVEVMWETDDGTFTWWPAEVITISSISVGKVLAVGTIVYEKRQSYDMQSCEVEFLVGQLLRPKREKNKSKRLAASENSWRLCPDITPDEADDKEWIDGGNTEQFGNPLLPCNGTDQPPPTKRMRISKCNIEQSSDPLENEESETRVKKLERVLESCLQRVMQLERSVQVRRVDVMDTMSHHFHETVTLFLRREILLQLQRPVRRDGINSGIVDGGHTSGHVSAHVDCTLTEFAAIARDVSSNKYYGAGFLPSFTATQSISSATNEAYITFPSLQKLSCWLCIK